MSGCTDGRFREDPGLTRMTVTNKIIKLNYTGHLNQAVQAIQQKIGIFTSKNLTNR